jgi:competence protein ComEA
MRKQVLAIFASALFVTNVIAAVDVNKGTRAELEAVKGIGPGLAANILDERNKGRFKDWADLSVRVKGIGESNAAKLSSAGLTVDGASFKPAVPPAAKRDARPAAMADTASTPTD